MRYLKYDLGHRTRGEIVEVTLSGNAANVLLMDSNNLRSYQGGRRYRYHGGQAKRSPVRLEIPRAGSWHVVVDHGGARGNTRASVRVLPGALPAIRTSSAPANRRIADIADNLASLVEHSDDVELLDVFISHASEDKDEVARPLAEGLTARGLKVWYDEFQLKVGDSLRRSIDSGLRRSRFGVVILSPTFFTKGWAQYELDGLVTLSVTGKQVLLPIWHQLDHAGVAAHSPTLADKVALLTGDATIEEIAEEIASVISVPSA